MECQVRLSSFPFANFDRQSVIKTTPAQSRLRCVNPEATPKTPNCLMPCLSPPRLLQQSQVWCKRICVQALTVEEAKERRVRMAKMRSLLFAHEQKSKRLKAIKSKGFHRHAKKAAKMKVQSLDCCIACHSRNTMWLIAYGHFGPGFSAERQKNKRHRVRKQRRS